MEGDCTHQINLLIHGSCQKPELSPSIHVCAAKEAPASCQYEWIIVVVSTSCPIWNLRSWMQHRGQWQCQLSGAFTCHPAHEASRRPGCEGPEVLGPAAWKTLKFSPSHFHLPSYRKPVFGFHCGLDLKPPRNHIQRIPNCIDCDVWNFLLFSKHVCVPKTVLNRCVIKTRGLHVIFIFYLRIHCFFPCIWSVLFSRLVFLSKQIQRQSLSSYLYQSSLWLPHLIPSSTCFVNHELKEFVSISSSWKPRKTLREYGLAVFKKTFISLPISFLLYL